MPIVSRRRPGPAGGDRWYPKPCPPRLRGYAVNRVDAPPRAHGHRGGDTRTAPTSPRRPNVATPSARRKARIARAEAGHVAGRRLRSPRAARPRRDEPLPLPRTHMSPVNVAVIGSGFMGAAHVDALRRVPGVNVVAIASMDFPRAKELAAQFGIVNVFDDWKALLGRDDVHAVHNCTPNNLHFDVNKAFLEAGKHVLSEKPLTMTSAESGELVRLARESGAVTAINFNYRGYPLIQQARGMVSRGELGELFLVHGHYLQDWLLHETDYNWRLESKVSGASRAIADIGSHW